MSNYREVNDSTDIESVVDLSVEELREFRRVLSVNGKTGQVELNYNDVGAASAADFSAEIIRAKSAEGTKQNIINDLETIRSGAAAGAKALQEVPATYRTAAEQDLIHDSTKQDTLTAGDNITIVNNVISSTGGGSGTVTTVNNIEPDDDGNVEVPMSAAVHDDGDGNLDFVVDDLVYDTELSEESENAVQNKVITAALNDKVDAVEGKSLSTNDFDDTYKSEVDSLWADYQAALEVI